MRDIIRFFMTVAVALFSVGIIWVLLYSYGQNRGVSDYQTPLVLELQKNAPISIVRLPQFAKPNGKQENFWVRAYYEDGKWLAEGKPQALELGRLLDLYPQATFFLEILHDFFSVFCFELFDSLITLTLC